MGWDVKQKRSRNDDGNDRNYNETALNGPEQSKHCKKEVNAPAVPVAARLT